MKQLNLFRAGRKPAQRPTIKNLVKRHLAEISAAKEIRGSARQRADEIIEQRRRRIRSPL